MNFAKLSGAAFMLFVLISAPFFAIQTTQDGINRVLADDYQFTTIEQLNFLPYEINFVQGSVYSSITGDPFSLSVFSRTDKIVIQNNSIFIETPELVTIIYYWDVNNNYLGYIGGPRSDSTQLGNDITQFPNIPQNAYYFAVSAPQESTEWSPVLSFTDFASNEIFYESGFSQIKIPLNYYQIMEKARLANYENVDSFTNIFYQIPRMASSLANAYNRFINWSENLNNALDPVNTYIVENIDPEGWLFRLSSNLLNWLRGDNE